MTTLFNTDNIFYLPPGRPFRVYDLLDWRLITIRVQALHAILRPEAFAVVHQRAKSILENAELLEDAERERLSGEIETFLHSLPVNETSNASTAELQKIFEPMRATFWTRMSQRPMESFFHEDYFDQPHSNSTAPIVLSTVGAIAFNSSSEVECELPSESPYSFDLATNDNEPITTVEPLPPDEPLPLLREYCGLLGSSNRGDMVTIDLNAAIPEACLAAIPIRRIGEQRYETLYLHLATFADERTPIFPFNVDHQQQIVEHLNESGFAPVRRSKRFSVWERGRDTIQIYRLLEGKESEGTPFLPSFCLATQADGSSGWEDRVNLLERVFL